MNKLHFESLITILFLIMAHIICLSICYADPVSGDIFKEYYLGHSVYMYPRYAKADSVVRELIVDDLDLAVKAEVIAVGVQPGHIGTRDISFRINNGIKRLFPQPKTPGIPNCYFYKIHGRDCSEIPLSELKQGKNKITYFLGEQLCHGFDWPGIRLDDTGIRVYYNEQKLHPEGKIINPKTNAKINDDNLMIKVSAKSKNSSIKTIDIIGYYYDYPFDGTSEYHKWHYFIRDQEWMGNIGKIDNPPFKLTWDLSFLADQDALMKLMARVTDKEGVSFMTPIIDNVTLVRNSRSVKLYEPYDVPENFKVRIGEIQKSKCNITEDVCRADSAILINSKLYIGHLEDKYLCQFGFNNIMIMDFKKLRDHHPEDEYPGSYLPIPLGIIKNGINEFYIYDNTEGHMAEVYWPGPALLVSYNLSKPLDTKCNDRRTYYVEKGPLYDVECFNYTATDSVSLNIFNNTERYHLLKANGIHDYIDYTVYVSKGEYNISIGYISGDGDSLLSRGQCQLLIDGIPQGIKWDQYDDNDYKEIYLGKKIFNDSGNKTFRLQVTGKNTLSQFHDLSICYIGLEEIKCQHEIPDSPKNLEAQCVDDIIELRWKDKSNNENGFVVETKVQGGEFIQIGSVERNVEYFYYKSFTPGVQYTFRIKAFNDQGFSDYCNLLQTISYNK